MSEEKSVSRNPLKTILWTLRLIFTFSPRLFIILTILQIFSAVLPFVQSRFFSQLIDDLIAYFNTNSNHWLNTFIAIVVLRTFISIFYYLGDLVNYIYEITIEDKLRKTHINKISSLDFQHFENKDTANLITKVNDEYRWRIVSLFNQTYDILNLTLTLTTALIILAPHYWYLALLVLVTQIPNFIINKKWVSLNYNHFNQNIEKNSVGWDINHQLTDKRTLKELKINNATSYLYHRFIKIFDPYNLKRINIVKSKKPYEISLIIFSDLILAGCSLFIIKDIKIGLLSIGLFTFYFDALRQVGEHLNRLSDNLATISEHCLHINNFRRVLELSPLIEDGKDKKIFTAPPIIEFKNVSFKYPNTDRFVFKNLNLTINPQEDIALVGANGAGKSTLIKLLCRFYDPTEGQILVNGENLKHFYLKSWYRHLTILFQEFNTYPNLSLKDNITISRPQKISRKRVLRALKFSDALPFVKKYSQGLDTLMSQRYGGEEPSWGQWQKIALARVFYRNTPIVILDEPTAAIDATSEYKIFNRLYQQIHHKTVIIVSHRFSTVRKAQRIIVIDKGEILEQGSHEELIKKNGFYAKSFHLQAAGYQQTSNKIVK